MALLGRPLWLQIPKPNRGIICGGPKNLNVMSGGTDLKKKKKNPATPSAYKASGSIFCPSFCLSPRRPAAETWVNLNPMPGGAIDLGRFCKGFELPDTHLLAALTKETGARSLSLGINPTCPHVQGEREIHPAFWCFHYKQLPSGCPKSFSLIAQHFPE